MLIVLQESMGEVTQVKQVLRTELGGIWALCLQFPFVLPLPVVGYVLLQCHSSHGVCGNYLGVIFVFQPLYFSYWFNMKH